MEKHPKIKKAIEAMLSSNSDNSSYLSKKQLKSMKGRKMRKKTKAQKEFDRINDKIDDLMIKYGPDGHTDGSAIITRYIVDLLRRERKKTVKEMQQGF